MDAVDEDEQSESSENNRGQLKSAVCMIKEQNDWLTTIQYILSLCVCVCVCV